MLEVFYTGGGIWLAELDLDDMTYAVVSSEAPEYFTIYSNQDEKYLPEDMLISKHESELYGSQLNLYNKMLEELEKVL